jgi:uncharacterized SAM-binding protein YcdF (DUF218 family)
MFFALSKFLWFLIQPLNFVALLLIGSGIASWRGMAGTARWARVLAMCMLISPVLVPIDKWLLVPLEQRFLAPDPMPKLVDGIILLGGAQRPSLSAYWKQPELNASAETLTTFLALARRYPQAKLVFSGGSGDIFRQNLSEAETVRLFFKQQGFDDSGVLYENKSRNTYENALFSQRLVQPQKNQTWLMITNARTIPRAMGIFRKLGWNVVPIPADHTVVPGGDWQPQLNLAIAFTQINEGLHEWLGMIAYYFSGKSGDLFPAPSTLEGERNHS